MSRVNSIYLVCECGFFYGDMRLYENAGIDCPECLQEKAAAFASLGDALAHQEQIRAGSRAANGHSGPS